MTKTIITFNAALIIALLFIFSVFPACDPGDEPNPNDSIPIDTIPVDTIPVDTIPETGVNPREMWCFGVNLSGGEFGGIYPGMYGGHYAYPTKNERICTDGRRPRNADYLRYAQFRA